MDLEQLEALALSGDRAAALAGLLPGTAPHDYWRGVHLQLEGKLDEVDAILSAWWGRHQQHGDLHARLARRQLLLRAGADLAAVADTIRLEAGVSFDDQAESVAAARRFPARLDPALVDGAALVEEGLRRASNLAYLTDRALPDLLGRPLDAVRRRGLLARLGRWNAPGALALVVDELSDPSSRGFGALPCQHLLTLAQLVEIGTLVPSVCQDRAWVDAVLARLRPPAHVDWRTDLDARRAYLDALSTFVDSLSPAFNTLKGHVLYHRLDLDRRLGAYERDRFLRYLDLPRPGPWADADLLRRTPAAEVMDPLGSAAGAAGLDPIGDDGALVREYLHHFLEREEADAFGARIPRALVLGELATARLLAGDPDTARWARMLPEGALAALRDRVDVEISARSPSRFGAEDLVTLDVWVKNVPELVVKVFRIDPVAYFLARGGEVDTSLDLDGMVAGDERTIRVDAPPIQRRRLTLELPSLTRPGTYVVELIGNGVSSRALVRKGALRHTVRVGAAGPTVRVYDEAGRHLPGARLWLGGQEHAPRDDGEITVPFSTSPGQFPVLLVHGDVAQRELLQIPAEEYVLRAGLHLERQALVPGKTARALLRPALTVAGARVPIALLEGPRLAVTVTDLAGTTTTRTEPVVLHDDAETAVTLRVPEDVVSVAVTLHGRLRATSTGDLVDLADGTLGDHNLVHRTDKIELCHLATTDAGHVLYLLGLTGEPRAGRAVALSLQHGAVTFAVDVTLATDERGRIELGALPGVVRVTASLPSGATQTWALEEAVAVPAQVNVPAREEIALPAPPGLAGAELVNALSLLELRGGVPVRDATDHVRLDRGALVVRPLVAGDYVLWCAGYPAPVGVVSLPDAAVPDPASGWSTAGARLCELTAPLPLVRSMAVAGEELVVRVSDAGPETRVHLVATLFRPDPALPSTIARAPDPPRVLEVPPVLSQYVSGRDIGDEHRYVLERRRAARRPGVLLDKPSLLLDPWARRTTTNAVQAAAPGGAYAPVPSREAMYGDMAAAASAPSAGDEKALGTYDFLAEPAVVIDGLRPDEDGVVRVLRSRLGQARFVRAFVVGPALTSSADLPLAETSPAPRDRRLRLALDPTQHFAEDRRVEGLAAGAEVVVEDVRTGKLELVDTVARAHQILYTLLPDDALREFAFVARWHDLDETTRRAQYSEHACHELNLFLHRKAPAFFEAVVRPHLANKRYPTFVDRFLLGEDVSSFLEPWAFDRLSTLEQILLARRIPEVRASIARLVGDMVDLIPPDPEGEARLVGTLLGATALEEGSPLTGEVADELMDLRDVVESAPRAAARAPMAKALASLAGAAPTLVPPAPSASPAPTTLTGGAAPRGRKVMRRGGGGADRDQADLAERARKESFYRGADRTQEWAETGWWKKRVAEVSPLLVPPNRFWRDLARHDDASGPFLSPYMGECAQSFSEAMACLAFLDLPFVAGKHDVAVDDVRLTLTARSPALCARTRIAAVAAPDASSAPAPVLVGQAYVRADDRWTWEGPEKHEKYVTGEMLAAVVYACCVTVTNPTSARLRLDVLLQIPRGAVPVDGGFVTRTKHLHLGAYATEAVEYAFYFPAPGAWTHFPAHVLRAGALVAWAPPATLNVVREPTIVDAGSWAHVSQHGTTDEVIAFLEGANLGRVDLARIAWRMGERDAFTRVTALLAARHTYHDRLWAYALLHADRARAAEWIRHQDAFLRAAGPVLDGGLAGVDPFARGWYEHLEYAPLVNARAHQLGKRRRILNDALAAQYRAFLDLAAHRKGPGDDELLTAAQTLFCLERTDDALAALDRVRPERVGARLQHAYLAAYAAACRGDLAAARRLAEPWAAHPVDRWRRRFAALLSMLDEAEGRAKGEGFTAISAGPDDRDRRMDELAARQPSLALAVEGGALVLSHHHVAACQIRFHRMDLELYFSREPFLQRDVERFAWIAAGHVLDLALGADGTTPVPVPKGLARENLVVEAAAPGVRAQSLRYANDLAVQLAHAYGQVRVLRASTAAPLPATYVKVYARQRGGGVAFYKDGYTDLRGRFDYVTLSTDDLDRVERFALLVVSDAAGATVLEAPPPQR